MSEATKWVPLARLAEEMNMNLFSLKRSLKGKGILPRKIVVNGREVDAIASNDARMYQARQNTTAPIDSQEHHDSSNVARVIIQGRGLVVSEERDSLNETIVISNGLKTRATATSLYLMPDDHKRLRKLAIDRDVSMQTLILDFIDLGFSEAGLEPVERWETRRKER